MPAQQQSGPKIKFSDCLFLSLSACVFRLSVCLFVSLPASLSVSLTTYMEVQRQTNDNAITVGGHKPVMDNSIDRDQFVCHAINVHSTDGNQA